jgi:hypothetical protein
MESRLIVQSNKLTYKNMKKNPCSGRRMVLWSCGVLLTVQLAATAQTLSHRYSFFSAAAPATNAVDSVGAANGTFNGDAMITGGQLQLDGNAWVQLPVGIVTNDLAVTVEAWGDYPGTGQGTWANLFDFGTQDAAINDSYSISFCVNTGSPGGDLDAAISDFDNANVNRQNCYASANLIAGQTGAYIAAVFNPPAGYIAIYVNGTLAARLTGVTNTITPGVRDLNNWIGWDNWPDPKMTANIDEFRIWNGAFDAFKVAASYQGGFTNISTNAGTITGIQLAAGFQVINGGQEPATVLATASLITNSVDVTTLCTYSSGNTNILTVDSNGGIHGVKVGSTSVTATLAGKSSSQTVTVIEPVSVLTHRYSFTADASDSVGTLGGTLMGNAVISNGQVVLDGSAGTYVDLSSNSFADNGVISGYQSATIDYWATFGNLGNWSYAFAFGNTVNGAGQNYVHNVARNGRTGHRIDNTTSAGGASFDMGGDFNNELVHCTTIIDPPTGHLAVFTNGVLSGVASTDFAALSSIATNLVYIGRSLWTADPYAIGSFDEFRVYNGALTPQQIAVADLHGPNNTNVDPGALLSIQVSLPQMQLGTGTLDGLIANYANLTNYHLAANSLTPLFIFTSSNSNVVYQATDGQIHAVGLGTATVTASYLGLSSSQSVTVVPRAPAILTHRYSFTADATDSVGTLNGTLMGNAVISNGLVVLDGSAGTYVDLSSNSYVDNGIISGYQSATIDYWATFGNLGNWSYAFAFGNTVGGAGQEYIHNVARNGGTGHRIDHTTSGGGAIFDMNGDFNNESVHCTTIVDPVTGTLAVYTNGVLSGISSTDFGQLTYINTNLIYIGRSLWTADPYAIASFDEFRVYNGVLTPQQIAVADLHGPNNTNTDSGALQSLSISLPATLELGTSTIGSLFANYANLTNYNLTINSPTPLFVFTSDNPGVLYQGTDGRLHAVGVGTATITATYLGLTVHQLVTVVRPPAPVLVHRYSFHDAVGSTSVADSVGGPNWNGTLPNGGTLTGSMLQLAASNSQYVQLPAGILSNYTAVTVDVWATFPTTLPGACFLYGFGNTDTNGLGDYYIFCQPQNGRIAITDADPGYLDEQGTGGAGNFSLLTNLHVTTVYDSPAGYETLYTNGVLVSSNISVTIPFTSVQSVLNYIGRSLYTGDAYMDLDVLEFRIYNGSLLADEVATSQALGPSVLPAVNAYLNVSLSAGNVVISWPLSVGSGLSLYSSPTLGPNTVWTLSTNTVTTVGQNYQVIVPAIGKAQFYELKH